MQHTGKMLLLGGLVLIVLGAVIWGLGYRGLSGDIRFKSAGFRFYFPIVTCLVLSVLLTSLLWLWRWLWRG